MGLVFLCGAPTTLAVKGLMMMMMMMMTGLVKFVCKHNTGHVKLVFNTSVGHVELLSKDNTGHVLASASHMSIMGEGSTNRSLLALFLPSGG